jgi:hypothetical protein
MQTAVITEQDCDNIRAFQLKMLSNMPRIAFDRMRETFSHKMDIKLEFVILSRIAILSGIEPVPYDCCINACVVYTLNYEHHRRCPVCKQVRYGPGRQPRARFLYLPLIPRLQAIFQNPKLADRLSYRDEYIHQYGSIRDVFDGTHYRKLCCEFVRIDGELRPHKYFCDKRDVALALCVDGYLLFKRRRSGPSATPILLQNFNLLPQIRTHIDNLICVGIMPKQPKEMETFLAPLDDELAKLAYGVRTFDAASQTSFDLHAYVIFKFGDLIAIQKLLGVKGHNSLCPWRSCKISGVRNPNARGKVFYVPHATPQNGDHTRDDVDMTQLPMRKHSDFTEILERIQAVVSEARKDDIVKAFGIARPAALT